MEEWGIPLTHHASFHEVERNIAVHPDETARIREVIGHRENRLPDVTAVAADADDSSANRAQESIVAVAVALDGDLSPVVACYCEGLHEIALFPADFDEE